MTIDEGAKSIVKAVCDWLWRSESETYAIINFPSMFIHSAKGVLKHTHEFGQHYKVRELKQRNINFHIEGRKLIRCNVYEGRFDEYSHINNFNQALRKHIDAYYANAETNEKSTIEHTDQMLNLSTLENFKF